MKDISVLALLFLATFAWGVGFPISKIGIHYIPPFTFALFRFFITSVMFIIILNKKDKNILSDMKKYFIPLSMMGLSGITIYNFFYLYSLKFTLASNSVLIASFNPIITTIIAAVFLKEKINFFMGLGILISLFGVLIIISHGSLGVILNFSFNLGDIFMLIATFLWAVYSVLGKKIISVIGYSKSVALSTILGTLYLIPLSLFFEDGVKNTFSYPFVAWASVLYMAFVATLFAFSVWYKGVERFGAAKTSIFVNLVPVFGVISSSFMLHEKVGLTTIAGGVLVIVGVIITNKSRV